MAAEARSLWLPSAGCLHLARGRMVLKNSLCLTRLASFGDAHWQHSAHTMLAGAHHHMRILWVALLENSALLQTFEGEYSQQKWAWGMAPEALNEVSLAPIIASPPPQHRGWLSSSGMAYEDCGLREGEHGMEHSTQGLWHCRNHFGRCTDNHTDDDVPYMPQSHLWRRPHDALCTKQLRCGDCVVPPRVLQLPCACR